MIITKWVSSSKRFRKARDLLNESPLDREEHQIEHVADRAREIAEKEQEQHLVGTDTKPFLLEDFPVLDLSGHGYYSYDRHLYKDLDINNPEELLHAMSNNDIPYKPFIVGQFSFKAQFDSVTEERWSPKEGYGKKVVYIKGWELAVLDEPDLHFVDPDPLLQDETGKFHIQCPVLTKNDINQSGV